MAVGVKNTKVSLTDVAQALGALTDGVTFSSLAVRAAGPGIVAMGNSGVTQANGLHLPEKDPLVFVTTITAADLFFVGPGTLEIFGIATA